MTTAEDIYEVLIEAKNMLRNGDAWCQGTWTKSGDDGKPIAYCANNAIGRACVSISAGRRTSGLYSYIVQVFGDANGMGCYSIPPWNDNQNRTWEDIEEAFDKAIELAKKRIGEGFE